MLYVTTSWDDGSVFDLKLAALLTKYGARGTFYIVRELPAKYQDKKLLTEEEIQTLSHTQEIGAHTLTHPNLTTVSAEHALREIEGSKVWLEKLIGREVKMFCYPFGIYDTTAASLVRQAGFRGARTTRGGDIFVSKDPFLLSTTMQITPFPFKKVSTGRYYWRYLLEPWIRLRSDYSRIGVPTWSMSWLQSAQAAFDYAYKHGEVFHVWGHSWELERYNMWNDLEQLLQYISEFKDVQFVSNSELLEKTS